VRPPKFRVIDPQLAGVKISAFAAPQGCPMSAAVALEQQLD